MITVRLKPKKEESVKRLHPWIFSGAIQSIEGNPEEGDIVKVFDAQNNFLGIGHYQKGSIAVKIFSFEDVEINESFWFSKIQKAFYLRQSLGIIQPSSNNTYRLIHGEGDFLPGLIIDVYGDTAVMQAHSIGMHHVRHILAKAVIKTVPDVSNIYYKSMSTLPHKADISDKEGYLMGDGTKNHIILENGLKFYVDWFEGQKTGFFIDQRENRSLLERYSNGKSVLNMFCYTGAFSVYALRGNARLVHSVDSSSKAIEITNKNVALNFPNEIRHQSFVSEAFDYFHQFDNQSIPYNLIILDPPAFAKHQHSIQNALRGYKHLNSEALQIIQPGGILFTFSCSQAISKEQFRLAIFSASAESKRKVRILHQLSQPMDHPINIYHPEGEYLKGLVLWVE